METGDKPPTGSSRNPSPWDTSLSGWIVTPTVALLLTLGYPLYLHWRSRQRAQRLIARELGRNLDTIWFHLGGGDEVTPLVSQVLASIAPKTGLKLEADVQGEACQSVSQTS